MDKDYGFFILMFSLMSLSFALWSIEKLDRIERAVTPFSLQQKGQ